MIDEWALAKLRQIGEAARETRYFVEGLNQQDFLADAQIQKACSMNLIIIGEAAKRIIEHAPELAEQSAKIEWRQLAGMRNRIAHGYEHIDFDTVWNTIVEDLPELITKIDKLLSQSP